MAATDKDTIYIDIDDEITGVIDKLKGSSGKVVALVLPKRAAVFQSIVNMKLLKRAADETKKNVVLITTEAGLMPLAGAAGLYVAKTLASKPEIPLGPEGVSDDEEAVDEDAGEPEALTAENAADRPVGELAAAAGAAALKSPDDNGVETLELDDDELPADMAPAAEKTAPAAKKPPKDKKLHVPNFNRFRLLLIVAVLVLILLIIGAVLAASILPKAAIDIQTDATNVPVSLDLTLSTTASSLDTTSNTVPARTVQQQKTYSQQVTTTGQKNNGTKAQGTVTMSAGSCSGNVPDSLPDGTALSANNQTYITEDTVTFTPAVSHGHCTFEGVDSEGQSSIPIIAQSPGSSFNVSGVSFTVAGNPGISANGSASGGTDNIEQVVSQSDITNAESKISTNDNSVKQALESQLKGEDYYPVAATFSAGTPTTTQSANVGDVASTVTVTETVTYTMFGADQSDLKSLLDQNIKNQIDTANQSLLTDGLNSATFSVNNSSATSDQVTLTTTATAGPQLNISGIKQQAVGLKPGDVENQLENNPDVTKVNVKLSPFWVSSVPKKTSKITVNIAKPTKTEGQNSGGNP